MGMVWRYFMWFFMVLQKLWNYRFAIRFGWNCSYSYVVFFNLYIPGPSQGAYTIQFPGFGGEMGQKITSDWRIQVYGWSCGSTIPQRVPGHLFQKSNQKFNNSSTQKFLFPKSWGKMFEINRIVFHQKKKHQICWSWNLHLDASWVHLGPRQLRTAFCCHAALAVALVLTWRWGKATFPAIFAVFVGIENHFLYSLPPTPPEN